MKRFASIVMATVLILSMSVLAYADPPMEGGNWYCRFTPDEAMESNFYDNNIDKVVYGMQPGDTVVFYMELENQHEATTDWYMENKVLKSLEASQTVAKGGAYTYDLRYVGPDGEEDVLYTSSSVGGEGKSMGDQEAGKVGLKEATSALEQFFYLDTLASGEKGNITLTVGLEGETQGNTYQDTLAQLQMNFAVELSQDQPANPGNPNPGSVPDNYRPVRTGDESNLLLWSGIMLVCGIGVLVLAVYSLRRNRKYKGEDRDE